MLREVALVSRNPTGESGAAPLDEATRAKLAALAGAEGCDFRASFPDLSEAALARALTGLPVRPATRALIRLGLERLAEKATAALNRASVPGDEMRVIPIITCDGRRL